MEAPGALPPLRLRFKPNGDRTLEDEFSGWFSGASIVYLTEQGRPLVRIPLQTPSIKPNGEFELPALIANWASESGAVTVAGLVDREGRSMGIVGEVRGPDGGPLQVKKGQIVEFVWADENASKRDENSSPARSAPALHLDQVIALQSGGLLQAFKGNRLVAQVPLHQRRPDERRPAVGAIWVDADTVYIKVPATLAGHGKLEVDLVRGPDLIATINAEVPAGSKAPILSIPLANYGVRAIGEDGDVVAIKRRPGDDGIEEWVFDMAKIRNRERREQRRSDVGSLREQLAAVTARLAELEGAEE